MPLYSLHLALLSPSPLQLGIPGSAKTKVLANVTFFADGTYKHSVPGNADTPDLVINRAPAPARLLNQIMLGEIAIDPQRWEWLMIGVGEDDKDTLSKISVRICNVREKSIKKDETPKGTS